MEEVEGTSYILKKNSNPITYRDPMLQTQLTILFIYVIPPMWLTLKYYKPQSMDRSSCCVNQLDKCG
jgi:hypothetical protein